MEENSGMWLRLDGRVYREDISMVYEAVKGLVQYGLDKGLISEVDAIYARNQILDVMGMDEYEEPQGPAESGDLEAILKELLDCAADTGALKEDSVVYRDLLDTKLMNCLMPRPSQVVGEFYSLYEKDKQAATDYYYQLARSSNYIRVDRIEKDRMWTAPTEYGDLVITINLSKPEKDPKAIAAARNLPASAYPRCQLCAENEGYAGRVNHPARGNHRMIPITINGSPWFLQYSPYVYYNEHCICLNREHVPMRIDRACFAKLLDFVRQFPHYFVGSNADLPIVGGSILAHDHFQGGHYTFAMEKAPVETQVCIRGYEDVETGIVKWPMSVLRLSHEDPARLVDVADRILKSWRVYSDEAVFLFAETEGEPHNTITPIARRRGSRYELDLVLRNNITTPEHPLGVYHPHAELHHIKKENIGLIEVMGLAVLPARLKEELSVLAEALAEGADLRADARTAKHADWAEAFRGKYDITAENALDIVKKETGLVFAQVLEHAGVYKRTAEGRAAFLRFVEQI